MDPDTIGMVKCTLEGTIDTIPALEDEMVPFHPDFTEILGTSVRATLGNTRDSLREKQESFIKKGSTIGLTRKNPPDGVGHHLVQVLNQTILNLEQVNCSVTRLRLPMLRTIRHGATIVAVDHDQSNLDHGFREAYVALGDLIAAVDSFLGVTRVN